MKKTIVAAVAVLAAAAFVTPAHAAKKGTAEYERIKAYKKEQRELKEREKANPSAKAKGFWQREAERSGLAGTAAMVGGAVDRVIPGEGKSAE